MEEEKEKQKQCRRKGKEEEAQDERWEGDGGREGTMTNGGCWRRREGDGGFCRSSSVSFEPRRS